MYFLSLFFSKNSFLAGNCRIAAFAWRQYCRLPFLQTNCHAVVAVAGVFFLEMAGNLSALSETSFNLSDKTLITGFTERANIDLIISRNFAFRTFLKIYLLNVFSAKPYSTNEEL